MPQFIVPQFIDVEDKIIGPITTRQFIMGIGAGLFIFLAYRFADLSLFIIIAVLVFGLYVLIAFVKINGAPFYHFLLNIIATAKKPRVRAWQTSQDNRRLVPVKEKIEDSAALPPRRKLVDQELSSLSLLVDTGGRYRPEELLSKKEKVKNKTDSAAVQ